MSKPSTNANPLSERQAFQAVPRRMLGCPTIRVYVGLKSGTVQESTCANVSELFQLIKHPNVVSVETY